MPDLSELIDRWRYLAIFLAVFLGNIGVPIPEEAVLILAGYLVWEGKLWLAATFVVGIVSAVAGDNCGYWIGRHYGPRTVDRYGHWFFITPERFDWAQRFVTRFGPFGVFVARFLPGLRFMAGPLAGATGLSFFRFLAANLLGALAYVPLAVAAGYAVGYGLGNYVEHFERIVGRVEHAALIAVILFALIILGWRLFHLWKSRPEGRQKISER